MQHKIYVHTSSANVRAGEHPDQRLHRPANDRGVGHWPGIWRANTGVGGHDGFSIELVVTAPCQYLRIRGKAGW